MQWEPLHQMANGSGVRVRNLTTALGPSDSKESDAGLMFTRDVVGIGFAGCRRQGGSRSRRASPRRTLLDRRHERTSPRRGARSAGRPSRPPRGHRPERRLRRPRPRTVRDWVASADPDELPGDLITPVAVLAGMTAWFARYFTGDVPDDWDLDLTDQRPPPSSSIGSSSGSAKRACDAGDCQRFANERRQTGPDGHGRRVVRSPGIARNTGQDRTGTDPLGRPGYDS